MLAGSEEKNMNRATTEASIMTDGVTIGTLVSVSETGQPFVSLAADWRDPRAARTCVRLTGQHVGREVVIVLEEGCVDKPIILGALEPSTETRRHDEALEQVIARVDGTQVVLSAENEIVLRCGKASITLTRVGKVIIRGTYVSSNAAGVNRVKGGSVEIN